MSLFGKSHGKLNTSKNATVSLDSLLGILSSAYGTEDLDTKIVLEKDTVNLRNLSVDNLRAYSEARKKVEKEQPFKIEEDDAPEEKLKINIATSTSYLKSARSLDDEVDLTLLSIQSSENMKLTLNKSNDSKDNLQEVDDDNLDLINKPEENQSESDCVDMELWKTIGGFFVDDVNKQIVFDFQFSKKKTSDKDILPVLDVDEPDITIVVVDSTKQNKTKIEVPKRFLVSKMKYFAQLDEEFGLETLNVMVKCNLCGFQWLVQWLTAELPMCKPSLNTNNLTLILSFAYHLGADTLVEECLDYFSADFDIVMRSNYDIEYVFDDFLLSMFVARFSNTEIENISDDFIIFKERMFCILITLLADKKPSSSLGHYASLTNLFQCGLCEKLLTTKICGSLPCRSDCNKFSIKGEPIYIHELSPSWNLSKYIELMFETLKSWRVVYWRLWGLCHFLDCEVCLTSFPLSQADWCLYHSEEADYFPMNKRVSFPIGTYNCCGEITYSFNVLHRSTGCSFKPHKPFLGSKSKISTYNIYEMHKSLINCQPPEKPVVKKFYRLLKNTSGNYSIQSNEPESMWWNGFQLAPKEKRDYSLIPTSVLNKLRNKLPGKKIPSIPKALTYESEVHLGSTPTYAGKVEFLVNNSAKSKLKGFSNPQNSTNPLTSSKTFSKKKKLGCLYLPEESLWQVTETNKNNQDTQRDFEEIAMRNLVKMLTPGDQGGKNKNVIRTEPIAGTYTRIELDFWHEYYKNNKISAAAIKQSSVINRTFPLSWFRKLTI